MEYTNARSSLKTISTVDPLIVVYNSLRLQMKLPDAKSLYDRGNSQKREGDLDGAIESYERAINIHPDYAEAYCNLANAQ